MKRACLTVAVALIAGLMTLAPAHAEKGSVPFERGDSPKQIDIVRVDAHHGKNKMRIRAQVRDLKGRGLFRLEADSVLTEKVDWTYGFYAQVRKRNGEKPTFKLRQWTGGNDVDPVWKCRRATVEWNTKEDWVEFTAPQRCQERTRHPNLRRADFGAWSQLKRGDKTFNDFHPKTKVRLRRG